MRQGDPTFRNQASLTDVTRYSPDDDSCPQNGRGHCDQERKEEAMVAFTDARVKPRTVMIKTTNTATTILTVTCPQWLLHTTQHNHQPSTINHPPPSPRSNHPPSTQSAQRPSTINPVHTQSDHQPSTQSTQRPQSTQRRAHNGCFTQHNTTQTANIKQPPQDYHHTTTSTVLRPFFRDHLGEPVPEENFCTL